MIVQFIVFDYDVVEHYIVFDYDVVEQYIDFFSEAEINQGGEKPLSVLNEIITSFDKVQLSIFRTVYQYTNMYTDLQLR